MLFIIGDSLALPNRSENIYYQDMYWFIISQALKKDSVKPFSYDMFNIAEGGKTIDFLYRKYLNVRHYFFPFEDSICILQSGIVDCFTRPIPNLLRTLISKIPIHFLRNRIVNFIRKHRRQLIKIGFSFKNTSKKKYKKIFKQFLEQSSKDFDRVYVLMIVKPDELLEYKSPGAIQSVIEYNFEIKNIAKDYSNVYLIEINGPQLNEYRLKDGHHLSIEGNKKIAELIILNEKRFHN